MCIIAYAETFLGTGYRNVEFPGIFHQHFVNQVERICSIYGSQNYHIVKLKPFALLNGHHEDPVSNKLCGIYQVALANGGGHVVNVVVYLLIYRFILVRVYPFTLNEAEKNVKFIPQGFYQ